VTKMHMIALRKNTLNFEMKYFELLDEKERENDTQECASSAKRSRCHIQL